MTPRLEDAQLPWRGPGPGKPDLPLPPGRMPLRQHGETRKRWRYVGVYGPELMFCAARVQVGPFPQSFWALWDRVSKRRFGRTVMRPFSREVVLDGPRVEVDAGEVRASLSVGDGAPIESICRSGSGWGWTRKHAGVSVEGVIEADGRRWDVNARGVVDESAGYQQRQTSWLWSAGVGESSDGRAVAWNLVSGINDPPERSERCVWAEGVPAEPGPVEFRGLEAIEFSAGGLLSFAPESERARNDNLLVFRSRYRHVFGTFAGSLDGIELASGFGVMEEHEAVW